MYIFFLTKKRKHAGNTMARDDKSGGVIISFAPGKVPPLPFFAFFSSPGLSTYAHCFPLLYSVIYMLDKQLGGGGEICRPQLYVCTVVEEILFVEKGKRIWRHFFAFSGHKKNFGEAVGL